MKKQKIGTATMYFDDGGTPIRADFDPAIRISEFVDPEVPSPLLDQLINIGGGKSRQTIVASADLVVGAWFSKVDEIELADRDQYRVVGECVVCRKYENGIVRECVVDYYFEKVSQTNPAVN